MNPERACHRSMLKSVLLGKSFSLSIKSGISLKSLLHFRFSSEKWVFSSVMAWSRKMMATFILWFASAVRLGALQRYFCLPLILGTNMSLPVEFVRFVIILNHWWKWLSISRLMDEIFEITSSIMVYASSISESNFCNFTVIGLLMASDSFSDTLLISMLVTYLWPSLKFQHPKTSYFHHRLLQNKYIICNGF